MTAKPLRIPIFPLAGAILFPRAQLPLHIFEERYREMIRDALAGKAQVGMIQPSEPGDHPPLYRVGCIGAHLRGTAPNVTYGFRILRGHSPQNNIKRKAVITILNLKKNAA